MEALFKDTSYTEFREQLLNVLEYSISFAIFLLQNLISHKHKKHSEKGNFCSHSNAYNCYNVFMQMCFFCLCEIKFCKRNSITPIDTLMRGAIKKDINPQFGMLLDNMQQQKKTLKIIF